MASIPKKKMPASIAGAHAQLMDKLSKGPVSNAKVKKLPAKKQYPKHGDGHFTQKLSGPVEARKLKPGMKIVHSGAVCTVKNTKHAKSIDVIFIEVTGHPNRAPSKIMRHPGDLCHSSLETIQTD